MLASLIRKDEVLPVSRAAPNCMVWPLAVATRTTEMALELSAL